MLTVFRSKAGADVIMLWAHASELLKALGREPSDSGLFRGEQIGVALAALEHAIEHPAEPSEGPDVDADGAAEDPGLRQRAWPVQQLLRRAQALGVDLSWQPA